MSLSRLCSRTGCRRSAVATLTYVYADQTAVVGPLATYAEPHTYDLCPEHAEGLTAPRGWDIVRLPGDYSAVPVHDDLLAMVDAVREVTRPLPQPVSTLAAATARPLGTVQPTLQPRSSRRTHLRVISDPVVDVELAP